MSNNSTPAAFKGETDEADSQNTDEIYEEGSVVQRRDVLKLFGAGALAGIGLGSVPEGARAASEPQKLIPMDGESFDDFGLAIAIDGATVLVGARDVDTTDSEDAGAAYVFTREVGGWREERTLTPSDRHASQKFGISTAVAGDVAVVGAHGDKANGEGAGAAYVFTLEGDTWREQKLIASDAAEGDGFGSSVALSEDGTTVIVGAVGASVDGEDGAGAAYVFTRDGDSWSEDKILTASDASGGAGFGASFGVALDGDGTTALVGAPLAEDESGIEGGAAYVYRRAGGDWPEAEKLTAEADSDSKDLFGGSVGLAADGTTAVVGAYGDNLAGLGGADEGTAYVFTREDGDWNREERLSAADPHAEQFFGLPVAISGDGDTTLVGAHGDSQFGEDAGAAYLFNREDGSWSETEKLFASDPDADSDFGHEVAIDGATGLVGAPNDDENGTDAGAAYVFEELVPVDRPQIELTDVRPVQVVEDTFLRDPNGRDEPVAPDPPDLLAGRNTTVLFNLVGSRDLTLLSDDETVEFDLVREFDDGESATHSFELTKSTLLSLANSATPETEVFDDLSGALPVFEAEENLTSITLKSGFSDESRTIAVGPDGDVEVQSIDTMDIGYVEIADPRGGANFGGSDGRIDDDLDTLVSTAQTYIDRTYPVSQLNAHKHPTPLDDESIINTTSGGLRAMKEDLLSARSALEEEFPDVDFDVTVAFAPDGWIPFHEGSGHEGVLGFHLAGPGDAHPRASAAVRGDLRIADEAVYEASDSDKTLMGGTGLYNSTLAQEIGHHFLPRFIFSKELAMRDPDVDTAHARTEPGPWNSADEIFLDSTGLDLTSGGYALAGTRTESFMSYNFTDFPSWTDSHTYQEMLRSGLEPQPPEDEDPDTSKEPIAVGGGRISEDDGIVFTQFFEREGRPAPSVDGPITMSVIDANDDVLDTRTIASRMEVERASAKPGLSHEVVADVFTFAVPFPEEAAAIEAERNGTVTRLNPIERSLREAIARLPDAAFRRAAKRRRKALDNMLDELDEKMEAGQYRDALNMLEHDIRDKLEKWLQDEYETSALQPTKEELLALVDELIARLETLVEASK